MTERPIAPHGEQLQASILVRRDRDGLDRAGAGSTFSAPALFVRSSGEADIVAQGSNNSLAYYWANPGGAWNSAQI
jgi:hypothetical protein